MKEISYLEFQEIRKKAEKPFVVVCCIPGGCCPPSDAMVRVVKKVAKKRGDFDFFSINGRIEKEYSIEYEIEYAPETTVFYQDDVLGSVSGHCTLKKISELLDTVNQKIKK